MEVTIFFQGSVFSFNHSQRTIILILLIILSNFVDMPFYEPLI
jgi:hypothetical protein